MVYWTELSGPDDLGRSPLPPAPDSLPGPYQSPERVQSRSCRSPLPTWNICRRRTTRSSTIQQVRALPSFSPRRRACSPTPSCLTGFVLLQRTASSYSTHSSSMLRSSRPVLQAGSWSR